MEVIILALMIAWPFLCAWLAGEKGYSKGWAAALGLCLGPFALLAYVGLPDRSDRPAKPAYWRAGADRDGIKPRPSWQT